MKSVFVSLADELQGLLEVSPTLAGGRITRDRQSPVVKENQSAINIKLDKTLGSSAAPGGPRDWATDFLIECYRTARSDELPTEAVDELLLEVWARLANASELPNFIALDVQDVLPDPQIEWDLGQGTTPQVAAIVSVRIVHRTKADQLVPWSS